MSEAQTSLHSFPLCITAPFGHMHSYSVNSMWLCFLICMCLVSTQSMQSVYILLMFQAVIALKPYTAHAYLVPSVSESSQVSATVGPTCHYCLSKASILKHITISAANFFCGPDSTLNWAAGSSYVSWWSVTHSGCWWGWKQLLFPDLNLFFDCVAS